MQLWLESKHEDYPLTWEGLYSLLEDVECSGVAEELQEAVQNSKLTCYLAIIACS